MTAPFVLQVRATIEKYKLLDPRDRVLAGVSGGADSVCLLLVLHGLGYETAVAHLNHGLRGAAADEDEEFVRALACNLGLKFFGKRVAIAPERSVEAAGRQARKTFFAGLEREHGFTKIALAHNRDDRVETFLMNLLRGAGPEGLVSMPPRSGRTVRPLIECGRARIEEYLRARGQEWRTDVTNFDLGFSRNRLRHEVIPGLAESFNPRLLETVARTVEILEAEDQWMKAATEEWLSENGTKEEDGFVVPVAGLETAPAGLVRRILRAALREAGSDLQDVSFDHVERVRGLLGRGKSGKLVEIPGGLQAAREFGRLMLRPPNPLMTGYEYELKIPGQVLVPELQKIFRAEIVERATNETGVQRVFVDEESIGPYVRIRNWKPGDYYRPVGWPGGKLKKLFQKARIPRCHRGSWPVVVADSTIVWVASFPVSREFAPGGNSQRLVAIEALPA